MNYDTTPLTNQALKNQDVPIESQTPIFSPVKKLKIEKITVFNDSLLNQHFSKFNYEDGFITILPNHEHLNINCSTLMEKVLDNTPPTKSASPFIKRKALSNSQLINSKFAINSELANKLIYH